MKKSWLNILNAVDQAELYTRQENNMNISFSKGSVKEISGANTKDIALKISKDGRLGSAVSTSLQDETLLERALLSSKYQKEYPWNMKHFTIPESDFCDASIKNITVETLKAIGESIITRFYAFSSGQITPDVYIETSTQNVTLLNSLGLDASYEKTAMSITFGTFSKSGFGEVSFSKNGSNLLTVTDEEILSVLEKHQISQTETTIKTGHYPVVFSGEAMGALMTRLLSGVDGSNIKKTISPLCHQIGQHVTSELLTIYDDGRLEGAYDSFPFDDEGTPTQKTCIIEKGVLSSYLLTQEQSDDLNQEATGNAFKKTLFSHEIEDQPAINSTNFVVTGQTSPDESFFEGIEQGVFIERVMGTHTGNIPAGDYSLNIAKGYLIENGKLTAKLINTMISGNIYKDLFKVTKIGTKLEPMHVVFYPMGYSPMVKFENLSIVGEE